MSDEQKQIAIPPEEVKQKRKTIINDYKIKPYWTFREGINLLSPGLFSLRHSSPSNHHIIFDYELFDNIIRQIEIENIDILIPIEEIKTHIQNFRERWEFVKRKRENKQIDENDDFIQWELQDKIFDKIKIEPVSFIAYVKENPVLFSSLEILPEFEIVDITSNTEKTSYCWADKIKKKNEQDKDTTKKTPEEELKQLLLNIYPEIILFYSGFTKRFKNTNGNIAHAEIEEFKRIALLYYSENETLFTVLKKEHIISDNIYEIKVNQKKATIGKILKIVVDEKLPKIALDRTITTHGNALYKLAYDLLEN